MNLPKVETKDKTLQQKQEAKEQRRRQENAKKAKDTVDQLFPGEKWKKDGEGIYLSPNRKIGKGSNYLEEKKDAEILYSFGSVIYLLPEPSDGKKKYDAIVNGLLMEFKNVSGNANTLETQFLRSREQAPNVFINLEKSKLSKQEIISALYGARNKPSGIGKNGKPIKGYAGYNRFAGGRIILKIKGCKYLIYLNVDDLKIKRQ
jgi:hypothetical protein